ncbi:phage tail tube protein [Endozoicomonas acroporae]|uniref:phage tail tube protein n=1 Tax=Endozoicomonas acroporae TaxID=1701104 RepID=UPI0013D1FC3C|nr:phage tail tube protein [Endozoicomonas acroporae]
MSRNRIAGRIFVKVNGQQKMIRAGVSYGLGNWKRESIAGADGIHGYKEAPQAAFLEGEITDRHDLDARAFLEMDEATVTLELANGKTIVFRNAYNVSEGSIGADEANIAFRFESTEPAEEVK